MNNPFDQSQENQSLTFSLSNIQLSNISVSNVSASNISDQSTNDIQKQLEVKHLIYQLTEQDNQLIKLQKQITQQQELNNQEKDGLRNSILNKEKEIYQLKKNAKKLERNITGLTHQLTNSKQRISELEQMVKKAISDLFSKEMQCRELEKYITENQETVKSNEKLKMVYEKQLLEQSLKLKSIEAESMILRQQLDFKQSTLSNSDNIDFEFKGTHESNNSNFNREEFYNNIEIIQKEKDKKIEELLIEIDTNEKKIQELENQALVERFQYNQQIMQWQFEAQKLVERMISLNLGFELEGTDQFNFSNQQIQPIILFNFSEYYLKILQEKVTIIEQLTNEIELKEMTIQELQKTNQMNKQQIIQWADQARKLTDQIIRIDNDLTNKQQENEQNKIFIQNLQKKIQELEAQANKQIDNQKLNQTFFKKTLKLTQKDSN